MITQKCKRAFSARRLVLLATAANLAVAVLLVGPGGSGQSILPAVSTASAAESAKDLGRGWLGVQVQPVTPNIAEGLGMKQGEGALVAEPMADGPAAHAGIVAGDVITAVNGNTIKDADALAKQVSGMAPGAKADVKIWREGAEKSISLTLGEMPKEHEAKAAAAPEAAESSDAPKLGLMLAAAEHVAGGGSEGVVVVDIDPNGLASEHGFKTGDVILAVGGKKVTTPIDVRTAIGDAHKNGKRAVLMRLKSDDGTKFVAIPIAHA
jgi:serine protease Do